MAGAGIWARLQTEVAKMRRPRVARLWGNEFRIILIARRTILLRRGTSNRVVKKTAPEASHYKLYGDSLPCYLRESRSPTLWGYLRLRSIEPLHAWISRCGRRHLRQ